VYFFLYFCEDRAEIQIQTDAARLRIALSLSCFTLLLTHTHATRGRYTFRKILVSLLLLSVIPSTRTPFSAAFLAAPFSICVVFLYPLFFVSVFLACTHFQKKIKLCCVFSRFLRLLRSSAFTTVSSTQKNRSVRIGGVTVGWRKRNTVCEAPSCWRASSNTARSVEE